MSDILLRDAAKHAGETVTVKGWTFNVRSSGAIAFLQLRDGSGFVQAVVKKDVVSPESWTAATDATIESSAIVTGTLKADPRSASGFELQASEVALVSKAGEYPIGKKEHGPDFLLDQRHLWIRAARQQAILRVRSEIEQAMRDFFYERQFTLTDAPVFTPAACEGTTDLFEVAYFEDKAYLTQSGQLYLEATAAALGRVYTFGPAFRSEKSKTRRHLTEFWMLEAEAVFIDQEENMKLQEELVAYVVKRVLERRADDLKTLERDVTLLEKCTAPFPRLSYDEAIKKLQELGSDVKWGDDLGADDETILTKQFEKPVFIYGYPTEIKAFYMKPDPKNPKVALNADLLAPEGYGEIIGGSQRIDDLQLLEKRIEAHKLPKESFQWYLDLRRYGSVPHSGFGIGLERTVAWICKLDHVRETIPFPRLLNRIQP